MNAGNGRSDEVLRILVVDDDEVDRMAVRRALRAAGIQAEIREAAHVDSAVALLSEPFDCVLLDFNLPGGDGLRVLTAIRAAGLDVPVIVLTGQKDTETAVGLMKEGASDYLSKDGLSSDRLVQSVSNAVRLHRAESQAREAAIRFRTVQETSPDAFVVLRSERGEDNSIRDFRIEYVNPAACRMVGRQAEALLGNRVLELHPGLLRTGLFEQYARVVETGEPHENELHYTDEGLDLWLRITAVKLDDGVAIGAGDVSRRRRAEEEREQALAARSRFYAVMSHELRTPINAILGYNDLVLGEVFGALPAGARESIERSQKATRHLLELINDVLDLSKLESGKMEISSEAVLISDLLDELLATVQPLAESRGIVMQVDSPECALPITTDPRRLRQILLNLVSNAIKFGEAKPVIITCRIRDSSWVELDVRDHGAGIAPEDLERIFDEFVQLANAGEEGTGLGLAISKRLARLLGGDLEAMSQQGQGSVFRLRLPMPEMAVAVPSS